MKNRSGLGSAGRAPRPANWAALVEVGATSRPLSTCTRAGADRPSRWRILESDDCDLYLMEPDGQTMKAIVSP